MASKLPQNNIEWIPPHIPSLSHSDSICFLLSSLKWSSFAKGSRPLDVPPSVLFFFRDIINFILVWKHFSLLNTSILPKNILRSHLQRVPFLYLYKAIDLFILLSSFLCQSHWPKALDLSPLTQYFVILIPQHFEIWLI